MPQPMMQIGNALVRCRGCRTGCFDCSEVSETVRVASVEVHATSDDQMTFAWHVGQPCNTMPHSVMCSLALHSANSYCCSVVQPRSRGVGIAAVSADSIHTVAQVGVLQSKSEPEADQQQPHQAVCFRQCADMLQAAEDNEPVLM